MKKILYLWDKIALLLYFIYICLAAKIWDNRIFLMSTPWHGNLGDQAIILAEYQILEKVYPKKKIIEIPTLVIQSIFMRFDFKLPMQRNDVIALHGGGNLGSLYKNEEDVHRWIVDMYRENKIFFMPQSIFFSDDSYGQEDLNKSKMIYDCAKDFTIMERDEVSHSKGRLYFPKAKHVLMPDIVNALDISEKLGPVSRQGVCFFLRNDKEKVLKDDVVKEIRSYLQAKRIPEFFSDTVISKTLKFNAKRWKCVLEKLQMAKASRLVITDRYHGTIFSVITHTPVIVFKSYDTKISAGVKWFEKLSWVHYMDNNSIGDICTLIDKYCLSDEVICNDYLDYREKIINTMMKVSQS